jgi:CO/xanthine dehydrogenase Mo-binding subunit
MVWHALQRLKHPFISKLLSAAATCTDIEMAKLSMGAGGIWLRDKQNPKRVLSYEQLALISKDSPIKMEANFDFPTTPDSIPGGHFLYSFSAVAIQVEVDLLTGTVKVNGLDHVINAGPVVNPQGYLGQIEGGSIMALGYTLLEEAKMEQGRYMTENLDSYLIPSIHDIPANMNVEGIEELYEGDSYGPRGVGEIGMIAVAPAIAKAIHDAVGYWVTKLPVSREELLKSVNRRGMTAWKTTK